LTVEGREANGGVTKGRIRFAGGPVPEKEDEDEREKVGTQNVGKKRYSKSIEKGGPSLPYTLIRRPKSDWEGGQSWGKPN